MGAEADAAWRRPEDVYAAWEAPRPSPPLLVPRVRGPFWEILDDAGITLVLSREYEHFLLALAVVDGRPLVTYLPLPHPSGLVWDGPRRRLHVASTRNPNALYELRPVVGADGDRPVLVPGAARFVPGATYLHDLALIGGVLHGNAAGFDAIARLDGDLPELVWWPRSVERDGRPRLDANHLQLNSIAAGATVGDSYFTASSAEIGRRRPGHRDYPVDRRGVVFSGATREPYAGGLTRPHSLRRRGDARWVANSGYGELGVVTPGAYEPLARLDGWTRGLCFAGDVGFAGTSRVIARFSAYAPGLSVDRARCGVHVVDGDGSVLASAEWRDGDQIFALCPVPRATATGLPFEVRRRVAKERSLFFRFNEAP